MVMLALLIQRRTLPRVRELKHLQKVDSVYVETRRTLPRVRELKLKEDGDGTYRGNVAPFPGCVN